MTPSQLKTLLPELQAKKFAGMADADLYSYIRIYYSLYRLVHDNALEPEYGEAALYIQKLNTICRMLVRRYHADETHSRRITILDVLYTLHYATGITHGTTTEDKYFNEAQTLINKYLETAGTADSDTRYHALRLIMSQYYGCAPVDTPSQKHLQDQLSAWASQLTAEGTWPGITHRAALHRIHLYSTDAAFNDDEKYNDILSRAAAHYTATAATPDYALHYDVVRDNTNTGTDPQPVLDAITSNLPDTLAAQAVTVENTCRHIAREVQEALFR